MKKLQADGSIIDTYLRKHYNVVPTHKDDICKGDTILSTNGDFLTVCKKDITYSSFTGVSIFGDSFVLGHKLVNKVIFVKH